MFNRNHKEKIVEKKIQRLSVDLNAELHKQVKMIALEKNMTLSEWIEEAIKEKLKKEKELGF